MPLVGADTATPPKKPSPAAKTSAVKKPSTSSSSKSTAKHTKTSTRHGKSSHKQAASWRSRQTVPTPERYKEIQTALASRGYLQGAPTGVWDNQSTDALRRFQQDQNLEPNGKLNSLSLIALGLGAKHPAAAPSSHLPAAPPTAPQVTTPALSSPAPNPILPASPAPAPPDARR